MFSQRWLLLVLFSGTFAWRTDDHEYSLKVLVSKITAQSFFLDEICSVLDH